MLGNFAAGIFPQVLRPYKVGDFINAGGTLGTVKELGLFATAVLTLDSRCTSTHTRPSFRLLARLDTPHLKHRWRIALCDSLT
ncbi:mechanosensitive ion channel domain-containing protein [Hydrogenophaga sp.]|uniref:mechanosensitive ion channel domain-containing protein n=1 Tax=Hydrogenophaga sp. TaxID=1904254 RepID=UPI00351CEB11